MALMIGKGVNGHVFFCGEPVPDCLNDRGKRSNLVLT